MDYSFKEKVLNFICEIFGHFPKDHWHYKHDHAHCRCCKKIVTNYGDGKYV